MAITVPPPPRARAARSTSSDRRTGTTLLIAFVLARMSLLVLTRRASVDAACVGHCSSSTGRDDDLAAVDAAREAVTGDVDTASTLTDDAPLQQQRTPTMSGTLVLAGLIGLLGACGAAASIVHTVTGPVRRAVRVLQAPEKGRRAHRLRPTTLRELQDMSRVVDTAGHEPFSAARATGADARSLSPASEGPTATSGPPSSSAEELPTPAAGSVTTTRYAAARSRALGPTTALWHAVELDRPAGAIGGTCETTVCGSLVRMSTEQSWPVPARDVCPACSTLAQ